MIDIVKLYEAPWKKVEYEVQSKKPELINRRFGVENSDGDAVARYITSDTATLITLAPMMIMLVNQIANDSSSKHQYQAQLILKMKDQLKQV